MLAPICLFSYNRPWHTKQTIEALKKNILAKDSFLFVFSDGPKNKQAKEDVNKLRSYLKTINGFAKITIIEQEKNLGLGNSIIQGVTSIINKYGNIIVLEDDLITSPYFLLYMNDALEKYKGNKKVWHISGYTFPIKLHDNIETFFTKYTSSWGWATWIDRWQYFEKNPKKLINNSNRKYIRNFNIDGIDNIWQQVIKNYKNEINTWAVFWYATVFNNDGFCLYPYKSLIQNIGHDGLGENCGVSKIFNTSLRKTKVTKFPQDICIDEDIIIIYKSYIKKIKRQYYTRIKNLIKRKISNLF